MVKRRRSSDYEGTTIAAAKYNVVYIDTNIDTHLALIISDSETISDLKDQIVLEHGRFFPEIGVVKVHAVKVKRKEREFYYHLPDYMFVKSAFEEDSKSCFFYVDVSKCKDVPQIVNDGATNQRDLTTANLPVHDQGRLDDCFKVPRAVDGVQVADVQNGSSSNPEYNIPASNQEFKDGNVPNDVSNHGSYSSGQSVQTCNSAKKLKRKHNSLIATSICKDKNMSSQALCGNETETGNITVNTQNNKADKLLGSHAEFKPRDGQETSSCNGEKSNQNRKDSLHVHEQVPSSLNSEKCVQVNEFIEQPSESEKVRASSRKDDVTAPKSICSPGIHNLPHDIMPKMDHMDKTVERNLYSLHDLEVNRAEELNFAQDGLEKHGESTLPSALSDTKEVNVHKKGSKKNAKSSKSKILDDHDDQVRNLMVDSHLALPDTGDQELPECAKFEKERSILGKHDVIAAGVLGSSGINHLHDDKLNIDNKNKTEERKLSTVDDPEMMQTEELDLLHCNSTVPSASLRTKEAKTHENSRKKRSNISRSGVQDEHVDRPGLQDVVVSDHDCCKSTIKEGNRSSKADVRAVEQNLLTKTVDTHEGTEGLNCGGEKKKKVRKSGAGAKYQQNRESVVAENDLNLEQVPETKLSSNSDCPDVPNSLDVNEATEDGKATDEKKQEAEKAVARVQDTGDMNRDADQTNDVGAVEQNPLTKTVDIGEATEGVNCGGKKKKKKVRKSSVGSKDQQNRESIVAENYLNLEQVPETQLSSNSDCPDVPTALEVNEDGKSTDENGKSTDENKKKQSSVVRVQDTGDMNRDAGQINDVRAVEQNLSTKTVTPEAVDCGGEKKKKKVRKSGAAPKDQENRESIVAENDLNLEQVPEKGLSTNSGCPDVSKALEVTEATEDGKAIYENKKKQKAEKAVAGFLDTGDMNRDADQINDKVSPSVDSPKQDDLMPPSQNDETYQKIEEERDLLVNTNSEMMVLSRDIPSYIDKNEPVSEPVSNTNTSTATVAVEQKMRGTRIKKRARKTVSGLCPDGMDTEKTQIRTRSSSTEWNSHANVQVEKDNDLLPVSKRIEASAGISSDTSRGKNTPPIDSALNQVSVELENEKDGEAAECIGKEINFKQYFVPSHPQDEVTTEQSVGSVTKKKRKEVVPSTVSSSKLLPESTKKDGIISSPGKANNLAESNKLTKTKKKIGKRGVPYATTSSDLDEFRTPSKPVSSAFLNGSDATKTVPRKKETVKSLAASGVNSSSKTYGKPPLKSNTRDRKESSLRPRVTTGKKSSSKLDGELVNKSKQEKRIGQTPKSIFKDVSSESSSGENGFVDSTASTCPPSDLSSSSDSSEDAATTGRDGKVKGGVKKGVSNSEISGQGHIPIGTILKSSSRFKKAKDTASQHFEDPDSQLDEFLPETQLFP